jgi:hypothetical protein
MHFLTIRTIRVIQVTTIPCKFGCAQPICCQVVRSDRADLVQPLATLRPENWTSPAGESPVRVNAGEPGSRPRFVTERSRVEGGVKSLFGGSKRAGRSATRHESCSLSKVQRGSRAAHVTAKAHVRPIGQFRRCPGRVPSEYGERHVGTGWFGTGEARLHSLLSKDRRDKPVVKRDGVKRESAGVVVPGRVPLARTPGKGPDFGHVGRGGKREGMAGTAPPLPAVSRRRALATASRQGILR